MESKKNVLIVYAHQEPKSFNGALKDAAVEVFQGQGHNVIVSDLYEMRFNPVASKYDFKDRVRSDYFDFQNELAHAAGSGTLPDEIQAEVDKVLAADLIILQFPMYWLGMPAILKGWIDRCLINKVAFDFENQKWFDRGPFINKKMMLNTTVGGSKGYYSNTGLFGDMDVILWPLQNMLRFTGSQILAPQISYAPGEVSANQRTAMLDTWKKRLQTTWEEEPLAFINTDHFSSKNEYQLTEGYLSEMKASEASPTPGQNLGRGFRQNCMTDIPEIKKYPKL